MAIKFQYNKIALQQLDKQLKTRIRALPTLKNKEAALRAEVKRAKDKAATIGKEIEAELARYREMSRLWVEFDGSLVKIKEVVIATQKIAGVKTPNLKEVKFEVEQYNFFTTPVWFPDGVEIVSKLARQRIDREIWLNKMELLDLARKKTTQKVNLYEKVQIPGFESAIRKIKRFLEDEENLSKSAQKIVKIRQQEEVG